VLCSRTKGKPTDPVLPRSTELKAERRGRTVGRPGREIDGNNVKAGEITGTSECDLSSENKILTSSKPRIRKKGEKQGHAQVL